MNLSTSLAARTPNGDPAPTYHAKQFNEDNASKAALNMRTVQLHEVLKETGIKVNSVSPGFVKTELTGFGVMSPEEGARPPVQYAAGGADSGRFVGPDGGTPW